MEHPAFLNEVHLGRWERWGRRCASSRKTEKGAIHALFPRHSPGILHRHGGRVCRGDPPPQAGHIQGAARPCGSAPTRGRAAEQGVRFPEEPAGFSSGGASEAGRAPDNSAPAKHCPKPWCSPGRPAYRILFRDAIRRREPAVSGRCAPSAPGPPPASCPGGRRPPACRKASCPCRAPPAPSPRSP